MKNKGNNTSKIEDKTPPNQSPRRTKPSHSVTSEALRLLFRVGALETRGVLDSNYEDDIVNEREEQLKAGIVYFLNAMDEYNIPWDIHIIDALLKESMSIGSVNGVKFVVQRMYANDISARATTFNALLKCYAKNGDGESAFKLAENVMLKNNIIGMNSESWRLLLQACSKTKKGR
jgi:pentatricopeptide repeat protein